MIKIATTKMDHRVHPVSRSPVRPIIFLERTNLQLGHFFGMPEKITLREKMSTRH